MFVDFTQEEQAIPLPWGMPAFELKDLTDSVVFIMKYSTFESVTTPAFTGSRVDTYIDLRDLCVCLGFIERAYPSTTNDNYFGQVSNVTSMRNSQVAGPQEIILIQNASSLKLALSSCMQAVL